MNCGTLVRFQTDNLASFLWFACVAEWMCVYSRISLNLSYWVMGSVWWKQTFNGPVFSPPVCFFLLLTLKHRTGLVRTWHEPIPVAFYWPWLLSWCTYFVGLGPKQLLCLFCIFFLWALLNATWRMCVDQLAQLFFVHLFKWCMVYTMFPLWRAFIGHCTMLWATTVLATVIRLETALEASG